MMILSTIRDLLKVIYPEADNYYCGKLDSKKLKSIGVYNLRGSTPYEMPVGGLTNKKTGVFRTSLLIHWNNNSTETEKASLALFNALLTYNDETINNIKLLCDYPIDISTDEKGIYERVIECEFYYNLA